MGEAERIGRMLKAEFEGTAWHGPSMMGILKGVTARRALARPLAEGHTIWEIVLHVTAWRRIAIETLRGKPYPRKVSRARDWPAEKSGSAAAWRRALAELRATQRELEEEIEGVSEARLEQREAGAPFPLVALLYGILHHDLYHAGQIAILKKASR